MKNDKGLETCGLCGMRYFGWGNNSWPLAPDAETDRCCNECNWRYVIPARLAEIQPDSDVVKAIRDRARAYAIATDADAPF